MGAPEGHGSVDRDLVESAQGGDREAYVDLIRDRSDRLFAIAQRILRDVDRAEDALQDALVIAWRDLRGLRDPDRFDAWLQRLLINVCIGQATRERRRTANLRVLPIDGPAAPDQLVSVADRDLLERGFRRLPPDQRAILVLHHYLGFEPSEIAETLGIPAGHGPISTPSRPSRHAGRSRGGRSARGQGRAPGMTQQRDIERLLDLWFSDGPTESPDRVIDVVADRIERQPQRPAWRFHLREIHVNTMLRAGIAVAAVVVVAFIGFQLLPGQSGGTGGPAPSPSSIVTAPPSAAPSPSGSSVATECVNGQGCPSPFPAGPVTSTAFTPKLTYTAPAGYTEFNDQAQAYGVSTSPGSAPGGFFILRDPAPSTDANACARVTRTWLSGLLPSTASARPSPPTSGSRSPPRPR